MLADSGLRMKDCSPMARLLLVSADDCSLPWLFNVRGEMWRTSRNSKITQDMFIWKPTLECLSCSDIDLHSADLWSSSKYLVLLKLLVSLSRFNSFN